MTTQEIIKELNSLKVETPTDSYAIKEVVELTTALEKNGDGHLACEAMIKLLERHPEVEFGTPGEPVHTIERYRGHYEPFLFASLNRQPTQMTIWMLNRVINGEENMEKKAELIEFLKSLITHENADEIAKEKALDFYKFQTEE